MSTVLERIGHLAVISLEETLTDSCMTTLATILQELAHDDDVWVTSFQGRSGRFGQDPDLPPAPSPSIDSTLEHELASHVLRSRLGNRSDAFSVIRRFPKPTVATLKGRLSGRGLAVALGCDLRLAARSASFAFDEASNGALPERGVMQLLSRIVGPAVALDLLLTGRSLDATEALAVGLISRVADDVDVVADELLRGLLGAAPLATRFAKEAIRDGGEQSLEAGVALELDLSLLLQLTSDRAEGLAAFHERRKPRFSGS